MICALSLTEFCLFPVTAIKLYFPLLCFLPTTVLSSFVLFVQCCLDKFNIVFLPGFLSSLPLYRCPDLQKSALFLELKSLYLPSYLLQLPCFLRYIPGFLSGISQPLLATFCQMSSISSFVALLFRQVLLWDSLAFISQDGTLEVM